jgi:hypothetical protein
MVAVMLRALGYRSGFDRIRDIIRNDATLRYKYTDGKGNTCVIGGLAVAAGIELPGFPGDHLNSASVIPSRNQQDEKEVMRAFTTKLLRAYPVLEQRDLENLQHINDYQTDDLYERRQLLLAYLDRKESGER